MGSAEAAELTKLAETTYRDVNIALANEFARFADTHRASTSKGHRCGQLTAVLAHPPPGHRRRRPLHPRLSALLIAATADARMPLVSREVNEGMPAYAVDLLAAELGRMSGPGC